VKNRSFRRYINWTRYATLQHFLHLIKGKGIYISNEPRTDAVLQCIWLLSWYTHTHIHTLRWHYRAQRAHKNRLGCYRQLYISKYWICIWREESSKISTERFCYALTQNGFYIHLAYHFASIVAAVNLPTQNLNGRKYHLNEKNTIWVLGLLFLEKGCQSAA